MSSLGMGMSTTQRMGQDQVLSPRMMMSMKVLLMPLTELLERVETELQENPFLEQREAKPDDPAPGAAEVEFNPDGVLKHDDAGETEYARLDELNKDWQDHFDAENRPSRAALEEASDRKQEVMQNIPVAAESLQDHLVDQLGFLDLDPDERALAKYVISHLDDNGYLIRHDPDSGRMAPLTAAELALAYALRPVPPDEMESAIEVVQSLDPPGVGARDTRECLLLQVTADTPHPDLVRALVRDHLEDVAMNRLPVVQKRLGCDYETLGEAVAALRHLDPKPGSRFSSETTQFVVPDVVVERTDEGDYAIRLTDDWLPTVYVSKRYQGVVRDREQPKPVRAKLREQLQSAKWLLTAIEQRRNTLIKVTKAIIEHQRAFLDKGPDHIQPLKMEQIADIVGVHVTTVSRAVDDKWVQTPRGLFPLRRFFGGGRQNTLTGEDVAWETVKQKLLEIIGGEDKKAPLSDEDIVEKFQAAGLKVARRTVTKYREALKIPSSRQRRDWTAA
jgi:RNA polymerase sigma-54 factor